MSSYVLGKMSSYLKNKHTEVHWFQALDSRAFQLFVAACNYNMHECCVFVTIVEFHD